MGVREHLAKHPRRTIGLINGDTRYVTLPKGYGEKGDLVEVKWINDDELNLKIVKSNKKILF